MVVAVVAVMVAAIVVLVAAVVVAAAAPVVVAVEAVVIVAAVHKYESAVTVIIIDWISIFWFVGNTQC